MPKVGEAWKGQNSPKNVLLRKWQERADRALAEHRRLTPPSNMVAVGSADMDGFFEWVAITDFLHAIRKGQSVGEAFKLATESVQKVITTWNNKGCKSRMAVAGHFEYRRWLGSYDSLIATMVRDFQNV